MILAPASTTPASTLSARSATTYASSKPSATESPCNPPPERRTDRLLGPGSAALRRVLPPACSPSIFGLAACLPSSIVSVPQIVDCTAVPEPIPCLDHHLSPHDGLGRYGGGPLAVAAAPPRMVWSARGWLGRCRSRRRCRSSRRWPGSPAEVLGWELPRRCAGPSARRRWPHSRQRCGRRSTPPPHSHGSPPHTHSRPGTPRSGRSGSTHGHLQVGCDTAGRTPPQY